MMPIWETIAILNRRRNGKPPVDSRVMPHRYRVFCCGATGEDCVSGMLETVLPLEPGHRHMIKGREWYCEWVDKNTEGEPLANFRLVA